MGLCHFASISTLNFEPWSTKLGGTVGAIKKMTHNYNGPGPSRNYGETAFLRLAKKHFFWLKIHFFKKITQKLSRPSRNFPDHPETLQTIWKLSRPSVNFPVQFQGSAQKLSGCAKTFWMAMPRCHDGLWFG